MLGAKRRMPDKVQCHFEFLDFGLPSGTGISTEER